ncbi:MAG TPA: isoaspartyl peptidase/L-asparaginase [Bacteroidota bacterium]|nr:isoaspartyl peptidase/L-asparaginase [Bacteroidota bacterium]
MKQRRPVSLVVHGGAWAVPDDEVASHRSGVLAALKAGWEVLNDGASATEAVERAVSAMENNPVFNAGRGAALNSAGEIELDAAIMEGGTLQAGAVAALRNVANPISVARALMEQGDTVLLVGLGATLFAKEQGIPTCGPDALITVEAVARWRDVVARSGEGAVKKRKGRRSSPGDTVGAVALDALGRIASGSSTGGTPNKRQGRVGDSALIGCGVYADSAAGGCSATGWGEGIIRVVLARSVVGAMRANGGNADAAAREGIALLKKRTGGEGGVIALNSAGAVGIACSTKRMPRAYMNSSLKSPVVAV